MTVIRKSIFEDARRVVIKVGSNVLTQDHGLKIASVRSISRQICRLIDSGREAILVTSGAMASGVKKVGLDKRPEEIPKRQAVAAVGQAGLILEYEKAFAKQEKRVAQILLTGDDLNNRKRYLNARNTLNMLLIWQVVPIVNENDTVMVEEIKFGDNDNLAAMITLLMDADVLVNLTDIDGLYTGLPQTRAPWRGATSRAVRRGHRQGYQKIRRRYPGPFGYRRYARQDQCSKKGYFGGNSHGDS